MILWRLDRTNLAAAGHQHSVSQRSAVRHERTNVLTIKTENYYYFQPACVTSYAETCLFVRSTSNFHALGCALAPGASTDLSNLLFNYWFARPANILAWILGCGAAAGVRAEQKNCRVPRHPSSAAAAHQLHLIKLSKSDIRQTTLAQAHTQQWAATTHTIFWRSDKMGFMHVGVRLELYVF